MIEIEFKRLDFGWKEGMPASSLRAHREGLKCVIQDGVCENKKKTRGVGTVVGQMEWSQLGRTIKDKQKSWYDIDRL